MCERPILRKYPDLVYGSTYVPLQYTSPLKERTDLDGCGPNGKYWEPTLKKRIINLFKKNDNN
jgi:hypothetical protein